MKRVILALGFVFVVLGLLALLHPNFDYHKHEEIARIGPVTATVDKPERTTIPPLAASVLLIAGAVLIVLGPKMKR
jgi:hypothetical protein